MSHHTATHPRRDDAYGFGRVALLAAVYIPTALISLLMYQVAGLDLVIAIVAAFVVWTSVLVACLVIGRGRHNPR